MAMVLTLGTAWLVACGHMGAPDKLTLSEAELQDLLQRRFPLEQRLLEVFEVRATAPRLQLLPEVKRLQVVLDLQARERILASVYNGRLDFDAALRWEAADQTVRLDQVRVQNFVLDTPTPPGPRRTAAERVAAALAQRVLEGLVLYRLPAEKLARLDRAGVQPAALVVTRSGLEITFAPKAKP